MGVQDFFLRQMMKAKMKDVPEAQREQLMAMFKKDPELMNKIAKEIETRVKKGGESEMRAQIEVMKKYRNELAQLMQQ